MLEFFSSFGHPHAGDDVLPSARRHPRLIDIVADDPCHQVGGHDRGRRIRRLQPTIGAHHLADLLLIGQHRRVLRCILNANVERRLQRRLIQTGKCSTSRSGLELSGHQQPLHSACSGVPAGVGPRLSTSDEGALEGDGQLRSGLRGDDGGEVEDQIGLVLPGDEGDGLAEVGGEADGRPGEGDAVKEEMVERASGLQGHHLRAVEAILVHIERQRQSVVLHRDTAE